jgi:hypothetical protein
MEVSHMKKKLKGIAVVISIVVAFTVWKLISTRSIGTPVVSISELRYNAKEHCVKFAIVKGKVLRHIRDAGYEIEQDGVTLPVAVGTRTNRLLPAVGKNIEADLMLVCSDGNVMYVGSSFSEQP